jgi:hypothetical protein
MGLTVQSVLVFILIPSESAGGLATSTSGRPSTELGVVGRTIALSDCVKAMKGRHHLHVSEPLRVCLFERLQGNLASPTSTSRDLGLRITSNCSIYCLAVVCTWLPTDRG